MKTIISRFLIAIFILSVTLFSAVAQNKHHKDHKKVVVLRDNNPRKVVVKKFRNHKHRYYNHRQFVVVRARRPHVVLHQAGYSRYLHRNMEYFYNDGWFYRNINGAYTVVAPPFGLRIKVLPVGYRTILFSGVPYLFHHGIYYLEHPSKGDYEVVEPAIGAIVPDLPNEDVEEVTMNGQTYYECNNVLYEPVTTTDGTQYKVATILHN